jgi:hypothetical protein
MNMVLFATTMLFLLLTLVSSSDTVRTIFLAFQILAMVMAILGGILILTAVLILGNRQWFVMMVSRSDPGLKPVRLIDHRGEEKYSVAHIGDDGRMHAPCHYMTNIGDCILCPDGRVDRKSHSSFMYFWLPLRKDDLVLHVMTNDLPDFDLIRSMESGERLRFLSEHLHRSGDSS